MSYTIHEGQYTEIMESLNSDRAPVNIIDEVWVIMSGITAQKSQIGQYLYKEVDIPAPLYQVGDIVTIPHHDIDLVRKLPFRIAERIYCHTFDDMEEPSSFFLYNLNNAGIYKINPSYLGVQSNVQEWDIQLY